MTDIVIYIMKYSCAERIIMSIIAWNNTLTTSTWWVYSLRTRTEKKNKPLIGDDFKSSIFLYNCLFLVSTGLIIVTPLFLTTTGWAAVGLSTAFDSCLSFALLAAGVKKTLQLNFVYNSTTSQADSSNTYHVDIC